MSDQSVMRDLFDRWERVWHEGQFDLIPECVGPNYVRHDEAGDRTVTREAYAAEIAKIHQERPGIMQSIFSPAARRDTRREEANLDRRDGELKMDWTKPTHDVPDYVF